MKLCTTMMISDLARMIFIFLNKDSDTIPTFMDRKKWPIIAHETDPRGEINPIK